MSVATKPAHGASAAELMDQLNTETAKLQRLDPHPGELAGAAAVVRGYGRRNGRGRACQGACRRQPDEDARRIAGAGARSTPICARSPRSPRDAEVKPLETHRPAGHSPDQSRISAGGCRSPTPSAAPIAIYNHGDIAPAHVHSPNASRTILSDKGGYTNVEGERCECRRGDIVFTPNGTWHDHGNDDRRSDDLDRHARLAADGISRLRLGRSELRRCQPAPTRSRSRRCTPTATRRGSTAMAA